MLLAAAVAATAAEESSTTDGGQKVCYSKGQSGSRLKWICQGPAAKAAPRRCHTRQQDAPAAASATAKLVQYTEPAPDEAEGPSPTGDAPRLIGQWVSTAGGGSASATDERPARRPATIVPEPEPIARGRR